MKTSALSIYPFTFNKLTVQLVFQLLAKVYTSKEKTPSWLSSFMFFLFVEGIKMKRAENLPYICLCGLIFHYFFFHFWHLIITEHSCYSIDQTILEIFISLFFLNGCCFHCASASHVSFHSSAAVSFDFMALFCDEYELRYV